MDVSREDLIERFREFSDEELLRHFQSGTLTALAADVAGEALRSRGIDPPSALTFDDTAGAAEEDQQNGEFDLVTVAELLNPLQANLLRACLESHGIFAYVWGEHLGTAHIIMSIAGRGTRVQVRSSDVAQAKEFIAAFEAGQLEIGDSLDDGVSPEAD